MTWFFHPPAALAALFLGAALAAQTQPIPCPRVTASPVAASQYTGPVVSCGSGIRIELGGIAYTSEVSGCPLFVIFYPAHEVPQPSGSETWVFEYAKVEAILFRLQCQKSYLIFIPWGSTCVHVDKSSVGTFSRLVTLPCRGIE